MESGKLQKIKIYQKKLKKLLSNELADIIIFGSFVKGHSFNDIDIALVLNSKNTDISNIKDSIKKIIPFKIDFQLITLESIYSAIWLTLIKEGFSVKENCFLYESYKITPYILFKYSLKKLNNVQKVQFARGLKKTLKSRGVILTRAVVLVPISMKNDFTDFLKTWNIYYESQEFELLPVLRKENFM